MKPFVTVILPTCDRPALLPRAVESVLGQSEHDLELIVIDSNRRAPAVADGGLSARWRSDSRVRIIRPGPIANASAARNAGLAAARGRWVTYLDDDDAYRPGKLARQRALAERENAALVLCGAMYHLRGRLRSVQCGATVWCGDDLLLRARWGTPLLFHRRIDGLFFDEELGSCEDVEFGHRTLARAGADRVPVVPEPLVDVYPQPGPRVNADHRALVRMTARVLALRRVFYSRGARRRFVLRSLLAEAKLKQLPGRCVPLGCRLLRESRGADWRDSANALAVSLGWWPDRWMS